MAPTSSPKLPPAPRTPLWQQSTAGRPSRRDARRILRRRRYVAEMALRGFTMTEIATRMNGNLELVKKDLQRAEASGVLAQVEDKLLAALDKVPGVFDTILDASVEDLQKNNKGYALKLKAAELLGKGKGALKTETVTTERRMNLHAYMAQRSQTDTETPDEHDIIEATLAPDEHDRPGDGAGDADLPRLGWEGMDGAGRGRGDGAGAPGAAAAREAGEQDARAAGLGEGLDVDAE